MGSRIKIGVLSDTHGLLRPEALEAMRGSRLILHAGDVGSPAVLEGLGAMAPVRAVRGNVDGGEWAEGLPLTDAVEVEGVLIYLIHDIGDLDLDPAAAGVGVIVSGHSHRPSAEVRRGVLHLNPGSAGPRRFSLPVSAAVLTVEGGRVSHRLVVLKE